MAPGGLFSHWRSRRALQLIRAECSSNGSWRSHPALAESSRTPASVAWGARIRESGKKAPDLLNDIFLVSSVSVVANVGSARDFSLREWWLLVRLSRCPAVIMMDVFVVRDLHSTSNYRFFGSFVQLWEYSVVLYLLYGRFAARLFFGYVAFFMYSYCWFVATFGGFCIAVLVCCYFSNAV